MHTGSLEIEKERNSNHPIEQKWRESQSSGLSISSDLRSLFVIMVLNFNTTI